jgi:hypothetical protein
VPRHQRGQCGRRQAARSQGRREAGFRHIGRSRLSRPSCALLACPRRYRAPRREDVASPSKAPLTALSCLSGSGTHRHRPPARARKHFRLRDAPSLKHRAARQRYQLMLARFITGVPRCAGERRRANPRRLGRGRPVVQARVAQPCSGSRVASTWRSGVTRILTASSRSRSVRTIATAFGASP